MPLKGILLYLKNSVHNPAILALVFAAFACQPVTGGGNDVDQIESLLNEVDTDDLPTALPGSSDDTASPSCSDSEFPMHGDAKNIVSVAGTGN